MNDYIKWIIMVRSVWPQTGLLQRNKAKSGFEFVFLQDVHSTLKKVIMCEENLNNRVRYSLIFKYV